MKNLLSALFLLATSLSFTSCLDDSGEVTAHAFSNDDLAILQNVLDYDGEVIDFSVNLPSNVLNASFGQAVTVDNNKAFLGKVLFYDNKLSRNESVNCSSCHQQEFAFADNRAFSKGFAGEHTKRNSLALGAVPSFEIYYGGRFGSSASFFWDERAETISEQSTLTIQDNVEMGMDMDDLVERLSSTDYYPILFRKAFGTETITADGITTALESFINALSSTNSKFDQGMQNQVNERDVFSNFTVLENQGKELYMNNCSSCHGDNFTVVREAMANNGLDVEYEDQGRFEVTSINEHKGVFKVPALRNIALTAPYMHDGRFSTLKQVVEHYSSGIKNHDNLSSMLRIDYETPKHMNFTESEKEALVAFLHTLTDQDFITDERYANPFK